MGELGDRVEAWARAELESDDDSELRRQQQTEDDTAAAITAFYGPPRAIPSTVTGSLGEPEKPARQPPLDWTALSTQTPPDRRWAIDHWLPMGCVTLLAGPGGIGKSLVAQAMGTCLALRREYLDFVDTERRVLFWACEDSQDELWRREVAIASWLGISLADLSGKLFTHGYDGCQVELAGPADFAKGLIAAPMLSELHAQIGDYKADVVLLDNVARLYGGNENDRHQVTDFIAMLTAAAAPTGAAVMLLGHPSKQIGSEYSGSTAWEAACRGRLYLGNKLPDSPKDPAGEEDEPDDDVTYLCRRKANYSSRDWRKLKRINGVMVPEVPLSEASSRPTGHDSEYMASVVTGALTKLNSMGMAPTASSASPSYLPKLAEQYKLLNGSTRQQFVQAMRTLQSSGAIAVSQVGTYANRTKKFGLICTNGTHE